MIGRAGVLRREENLGNFFEFLGGWDSLKGSFNADGPLPPCAPFGNVILGDTCMAHDGRSPHCVMCGCQRLLTLVVM